MKVKKFNVLSYYRKGLERKNPKKTNSQPTRIVLLDNYLNPNIKELRDRDTGKCVGLIKKKEGFLKQSITRKRKPGSVIY
jgi:hypothetical protein